MIAGKGVRGGEREAFGEMFREKGVVIHPRIREIKRSITYLMGPINRTRAYRAVRFACLISASRCGQGGRESNPLQFGEGGAFHSTPNALFTFFLLAE